MGMNTRIMNRPSRRQWRVAAGLLFIAVIFMALNGVRGFADGADNSISRLAISAMAGEKLQLAWPVSAAASDLETTTQLKPSGEWERVAQLPALTNEALSLAVTNAATNAFYRLQGGKAATVNILKTPKDSLVPDAVVDAKGVLHLVYGLNHNAYYIRSTNNGGTFTPPVKVNSAGTVETEMGERGPKLAVGGDGVIHVVWADDWAPGVKTFVRYSRSLDGGKTFEPLQTVSSMSGIDGVTVTADCNGNVIAFWHVMVDPAPPVPQATWLFMARSTNNWAGFGPSAKVNISNHEGIACSMCMMRARAETNGTVYLAFRSAVQNIRDFFVLKGSADGSAFTALRVNQDNWNINYCPMAGPELSFDPYGRALCAFMTSNKVYWAVSDYPITGFRLHVATPAHEANEIYPTVTANRRGEVLFLWQIGPMSTSGTATVKWARYNIDGTYIDQQGTIGTSFSGTKATAVVGSDDNFYIITTAQ